MWPLQTKTAKLDEAIQQKRKKQEKELQNENTAH